MKKKEVKRLLRQHPEFREWVLQDASRVSAIRANPSTAAEMFKRWKDRRTRGAVDFQSITQKTKRASEMLTNFQSIMEMMAQYNHKQSE